MPDPLPTLHVRRQYDGAPLKTEKRAGENPRRVPVHPELSRLLGAWKAEGFAAKHGRGPLPDDPIVPSFDGASVRHMAKKTAQGRWRDACAIAGVAYRTVHATRHTFITILDRGGAAENLIEKITHTKRKKRSMVSRYTHHEWVQVCQAVLLWGVTPRVTLPSDTLTLEESPSFRVTDRSSIAGDCARLDATNNRESSRIIDTRLPDRVRKGTRVSSSLHPPTESHALLVDPGFEAAERFATKLVRGGAL
jgi:hypothetical protein